MPTTPADEFGSLLTAVVVVVFLVIVAAVAIRCFPWRRSPPAKSLFAPPAGRATAGRGCFLIADNPRDAGRASLWHDPAKLLGRSRHARGDPPGVAAAAADRPAGARGFRDRRRTLA